jgi:hypothetical protein
MTIMPKNGKIHLLDVVALTVNLPKHQLRRGQVGTVVETLASDVYEVEFSDNDGRAYAMCAARADQLLVLHHQPVHAPTLVRERPSAYGKKTYRELFFPYLARDSATCMTRRLGVFTATPNSYSVSGHKS